MSSTEETTVIYTRTSSRKPSEYDTLEEENLLKTILFDQDCFYDVRMVAADRRETNWLAEYLPELARNPKDAYVKSIEERKSKSFERGITGIEKLSVLDRKILSHIRVENVVLLGSTQDGLYLEQGFPMLDKGVSAVNESDVDVVFEYGGIEIRQNCKTTELPHLCLTKTKHPGYFKLKICTPKSNADQHVFFKNTNLKMKLFGDLDSSSFYVVLSSLNEALNSAAIAGNTEDELGIHEMDNVAAFKMREWPKEASGFLSRQRQSGWPPEELIRSATSHGCGFVPKGTSNSKEKDYHWRISFAASEKVLVRSLSLPQIRSYLFFKSLCKLKLAEPEGLSSYMMKNILFWTIEAIDQSSWTDDNILFCVEALVDMLCACLDQGTILSYFLPSLNLIGDVDKETLAHLRRKARAIQQDTFTAIITCTDLKDFKGSCFVSMPILMSTCARDKESITPVCSMIYITMYLYLRLQALRYQIRLSPETLKKSFDNRCRSMLCVVPPRAVWYLLESIKLQPDTSLYTFNANGDRQYELRIEGMRTKVTEFWRRPIYKGLFTAVVNDQEFIHNESVTTIPEFREFIDWVDMTCQWSGGVAVNINNISFPTKMD